MRLGTWLAGRGRRLPLWVRVSGIVAIVLAGVFLTTMLLAASGVDDRGSSGSGHDSGDHTEMETNDEGSGGDHGSDGDHGRPSDGGSGVDHGSGDDHDPGGQAE
jgi:hypothetical protein